jgi:hypothetical protein
MITGPPPKIHETRDILRPDDIAWTRRGLHCVRLARGQSSLAKKIEAALRIVGFFQIPDFAFQTFDPLPHGRRRSGDLLSVDLSLQRPLP